MSKVLIIGCGGVASVAIHKCCQVPEVFTDICIASRTKSKCDKLAAELRDYERLHALALPMPELLEVDFAQERLLKEYIEGETVFELVQSDALPPEYLVQMRELSARGSAAGLNIDYFPTNFVARDGRLFYIDYECNAYTDEWNFENWGVKYWSKTKKFMEYLEQIK